MKGDAIMAVIITYNPDIETFFHNAQRIIPQVDDLVVFDNGSDNISEIKRGGVTYYSK